MTAPATAVVPCLTVKVLVLTPVTGSLKVAVIGVRAVEVPSATPVDVEVGLVETTVGTDATFAVVKLHVLTVSGFPAASAIPPVRVAV